MKFLLPNYSCLQNPWLGGYRSQIPVLSVLCTQLNLLNPPPHEQNSWVRHCPPNLLFKGYWGSKRPGHEFDQCPPCIAKVRMSGFIP